MKLSAPPEDRRFIVGHPDDEERVAKDADELSLDYVLSPYAPTGRAYIIDPRLLPFM